jgi:type I restriction enzyme R subunit
MTIHNENSRVKIPALIHLTRLGYKYLSLKQDIDFDPETNIIKNIFQKRFLQINQEATENDFEKEFQNIVLELGQDDLGKSFYNRLLGIGNSTYKLIDWENFHRNTFHVCTELTYKNGEDEFRPDITVFVNGLPLSFIEVKKPNNPEGIKAERDRIYYRFKNEKFRKFINITQLLVFSNNMEYDDTGVDQLQGAFYATTAKGAQVKFNNFREELKNELPELTEIHDEIENEILKDNNLVTLKYSPEFLINKDERTPTNRILTSLFTKERLKMLLQFSITYVNEESKTGEITMQKHIMRYPQFFAAKAIRKKVDEGITKGIIWHTQGSGKTALAYYCVRYLTDYFSPKQIVPKFYFIVDRLDLLKQAKREFEKRGLKVNTVNSKEDLTKDFRQNTTKEGITVINIQKFNEDTSAFHDSGYDISVQRIYFIDEAHRSYDPKGSSLANLYNSDKKSIKIALTGTPLIVYKERIKEGEEEILSGKENLKTTRNIFGDYIHKYYYNNSIKDGYTLKLLREEIETTYKDKLRKVLHDIKIKLGTLDKVELYAHSKFATPMLNYIINDFRNARIRFDDPTIGAMVVCDSSKQARMLFEIFNKNQFIPNRFNENVEEVTENNYLYPMAAEEQAPYFIPHNLKAALILHDENDKETRDNQIEDFKAGKIDFLFVYAMLLTGFDAPRLKKLYLGRKVKAHNLLQTLTRVNRPHKDFRIGYVVDFADISKEFDVTNKAYFEELNREYDTATTGENENDVFGSLFMSKEEIDEDVQQFVTVLSDYSTDNLELFSQQISAITDRDTILNLKKSLESAREIYNIARLLGYTELLEKIDFQLISKLLTEVSNRLQLLNLQNAISDVNSRELLNVAIEDVIFDFTKIGEEELRMLANDLQEIAHKTREELNNNWNQKDPEWVSLYEDFRNLLANHNIDRENFTNETAHFISREILQIYNKIKELNRKNSVLSTKFDGDRKYARIFKLFEESGTISSRLWLFNVLRSAKDNIDNQVSLNEGMLANEAYFKQAVSPILISSFENAGQRIDTDIIRNLTELTTREYRLEYAV